MSLLSPRRLSPGGRGPQLTWSDLLSSRLREPRPENGHGLPAPTARREQSQALNLGLLTPGSIHHPVPRDLFRLALRTGLMIILESQGKYDLI